MFDIETVKILPIDRPNWNGRIYSQSVVESAIAKCKSPVYGHCDSNIGQVDLEKVSHITENLRIENGWLVGDVKFLGTPKGKILKEIYEPSNMMKFVVAGHGNISDDGVVTDFILSSVNVSQIGNFA